MFLSKNLLIEWWLFSEKTEEFQKENCSSEGADRGTEISSYFSVAVSNYSIFYPNSFIWEFYVVPLFDLLAYPNVEFILVPDTSLPSKKWHKLAGTHSSKEWIA